MNKDKTTGGPQRYKYRQGRTYQHWYQERRVVWRNRRWCKEQGIV